MAIAVNCPCGKRFKVKDRLAGKKVRCPQCRGPLRIPGAADAVAGQQDEAPAAGQVQNQSPISQQEAEKALLRFEETHKNKQLGAEAEAAYQEERNKLIAAYDQLAGKGVKGKKKKNEPAPGKPRKAGFFTKLADVIAAICGTLAFKYVVIVIAVLAGGYGSYLGVKFVYTYTTGETVAPAPLEVQIDNLFKNADAAIKAKKWGEARDALAELLRLNPFIEKRNKYKDLKAKLDQGFEKG